MEYMEMHQESYEYWREAESNNIHKGKTKRQILKMK